MIVSATGRVCLSITRVFDGSEATRDGSIAHEQAPAPFMCSRPARRAELTRRLAQAAYHEIVEVRQSHLLRRRSKNHGHRHRIQRL